MKKTVFFILLALVILVGVLGGIKGFQIKRMMVQGEQYVPPPAPVTATPVTSATWRTVLTAVGSLEAVQGVMVTAELTGKVVDIAFAPGGTVNEGDLLVQQDISSETAQLRSAQASLDLARLNLHRAQELLPDKVITRSSFDTAEADYKQAAAQVDAITATITKKTIRAPFGGRLGLRRINLGQVINVGDPIVSLQSMDPIFVNFQLPQQELREIEKGLTIRLTSEVLTDETIEGFITAINPQVDASTRNIRLQATVANQQERLRPGMFVNVVVQLPKHRKVLTIPATAVLYAPYSNTVFVVEQDQEEQPRKQRTIRQQTVRLGEKRGDYVAVVSGLAEGDLVVSTGVFKLRNGQPVVVDNRLAPEFKLAPTPKES